MLSNASSLTLWDCVFNLFVLFFLIIDSHSLDIVSNVVAAGLVFTTVIIIYLHIYIFFNNERKRQVTRTFSVLVWKFSRKIQAIAFEVALNIKISIKKKRLKFYDAFSIGNICICIQDSSPWVHLFGVKTRRCLVFFFSFNNLNEKKNKKNYFPKLQYLFLCPSNEKQFERRGLTVKNSGLRIGKKKEKEKETRLLHCKFPMYVSNT